MIGEALPPAPRPDPLRVVQGVARLLASRTDAAALARGVLESLVPGLGADGGVLYLVEGEELVLAAATGHEVEVTPPPASLPLVGERGEWLMLPAPRQLAADEASPAVRPWAEHCGAAIAALAPIHADGARTGLFHVWRRGEERFDDEAMRLLDCVAAQAGPALAAARRAEQHERDAKPERLQLSVLHRLSSTVRAALDLDGVLARCLGLIDELVAPDACAIYLLNDTGGSMRLAAGRDARGLGVSLPSLPPDVVERLRSRVDDPVPLVADSEDFHPKLREHLRAAGVVTSMTVPLVADGALVGVIALVFTTRRFFPLSALHTLMAVAEQQAAAIDRARLHAVAGLRTRLASALRRVAERALTAGTNQETWDAVLDGTIEIARWPSARITLLDDEGALVTVASRAMSAPLAAVTRVPWDDPYLRYLASLQEPAHLSAAEELPAGSVFRGLWIDAGLRSLVVLPLRHGGRLLGYISSQATEPRTFHAEEMNALRLLASVAASALEADRLRREAESERLRLRHIIEHLPILVGVLDPSLRIVEANAAFRNLHPAVRIGNGYENALAGINFTRADGAPFGNADRTAPRALRGEQVPSLELRVRTPGGVRTLLSHVTPLRDAHGTVTGVVVAAQDITVIRELADTKDRFIHIASHELRSPLAALQACTQLLSIDPAAEDDGERRLTLTRRIGFQVERLVRLVDELLDMARLQGGAFALTPRPMNLVEVAEEAAEVAQLQSQLHHIAVEARQPVEGSWDRTRMAQVVTNLLSNAMRYSPDGGDVVVVVRVEGDQAVLSVRDHGIGIPPAQQRRLFEPYFRTQEAGELARGGLGLGLYITHEIVRHHGGRIEVESELGRGTRFTVLLPLGGPPPAAPAHHTW